jgi:pyridoxal phosphate enzyme (YggS family)
MDYPELSARLAEVRERIGAAASRAGRAAEEVGIVAVTKTHPATAIEAARRVGLRDVGENRVQEMAEKEEVLGRDAARWHLIGHLQRNKARRAVVLFDLLHSLDSARLAGALSEAAAEQGITVHALAQVNTSGEASKGGFEGDALVDALGEITALPGLVVEGLMTMAPFTDDERVLRHAFGEARRLRDEAARQVPGFRPVHLSMGMSNDFEIAVEEGSTLVRLGTILFGAREP